MINVNEQPEQEPDGEVREAQSEGLLQQLQSTEHNQAAYENVTEDV